MAGLKVFVLAALLLLVVAHTASAAWRSEEESCKKVNLRPCEKHIMQRIEQDEDEDQDHLKMRGIHYKLRRSEGEDEEEERDQKKQCCNALRDLDTQDCKCRALNKIMDRQSEKIEGKEQMKDMKKELMFLPISCGMPPLFGCDLDD